MVASSLIDPFEEADHITDLQKYAKNIEMAISLAAAKMQKNVPSAPFMNSSNNTNHVSAADGVRQGFAEALSFTLDSSMDDEIDDDDYDHRRSLMSLSQTDTDMDDAGCVGGPIRPSASSLVPAFQHFFSLVKTGIEDYRDEFVNGPTETVDDDNENANFDYRNAHEGQRHNKHRYHAQDDTRDDDLSVESEFSIKEIIPKLRLPTTANKGRDNFLIASSTISDFSESDDDSSLGSLSTQSSAEDEDDKKTESKPYMNIIFDKGNQVLNLVKKGKSDARNEQDPDGENQVFEHVEKKEETVRNVQDPDGEKSNQEEQGVVSSQPKNVEQLLQPSEKHDPIPNAPTSNDESDPVANAPTPNDESAEALFYHGKEFPTQAKDIVGQFGAKSMNEFTENEIADLILLMLRKNNEKKVASTERQDNNDMSTTQPNPADGASPEDFEHAMMGNLILSSLAEVEEQRDASIAKSRSYQSGKVHPEILPTVTEATYILPTVTESTTAPEGCIDASIAKSSSDLSGRVDPEIIRLLTEAIAASEVCIDNKVSEEYIETKPSEGCIVNKSEENDNTAKPEVGQEVIIYTMPSKCVEEDVVKENQTDIDSNSNQLGNTQDYGTAQSPIIYSGVLSGGPPTTRRSMLWNRRSTTSRLLKAIGRSIGRNRPEKKKKKKFFDSNSTVGGSTTRGRRGTTGSQRRIRRLRRKATKKDEEENPEENVEGLLPPPSVAM